MNDEIITPSEVGVKVIITPILFILLKIADLDDADRYRLLKDILPGKYCMNCGGPPKCYCTNDE